EAGAKEHLSVLSGSLTVQAADTSKVPKAGDSTRYPADVQHAISNTGKGMAKAVLVVEHLG
ncbi:MAG: cupin domain-containing protein, partial [Curvibacter sp.]